MNMTEMMKVLQEYKDIWKLEESKVDLKKKMYKSPYGKDGREKPEGSLGRFKIMDQRSYLA